MAINALNGLSQVSQVAFTGKTVLAKLSDTLAKGSGDASSRSSSTEETDPADTNKDGTVSASEALALDRRLAIVDAA